MSDEKFPHYWLCDKCAKSKGGKFPEGHCCTVTKGTCLYCLAEDVTLIPWVDFNWPKEPGYDRAAKIGRD